MTMTPETGAEAARVRAARDPATPWRRWGPYLSERQWGTVREDYSGDGDAWNHFPHDHARSRAYHWGEDGLAGVSDDRQRLCFALALWNGADPILKERLFGLANEEGNHGEDVKEYYYYLDSTPTHSYMKWLYKYPQCAYPYDDLVATNAARTRDEMEYELVDTGVFGENRYFDVFVEYAKRAPDDILIRITAVNRGPEAAPLHLLPTLWFRNGWSFWPDTPKPLLRQDAGGLAIAAEHHELGAWWLHVYEAAPLLFTENETNHARLSHGANASPFVKDGINDFIVGGRRDAVNSARHGTKAAVHVERTIEPGAAAVIRLRLTNAGPHVLKPFDGFDALIETRRRQADEFYDAITPRSLGADAASVLRQALAGMLWTKQYYFFDANKWLEEHGADPFAAHPRTARNDDWPHMTGGDVISMPDKWEYPWFAAWDLAFHAVALGSVDIDFAKDQLELMIGERYMHPNGQIPAYEWNFSDVNPPVHAWATMFLHRNEEALRGRGDVEFLKRTFVKLLANFTWWVNRKDRFGKNVFGGGFLGLDNIGVFDRSKPLPTGGHLEQADGTAWMALFCQNMLEMAVEIVEQDPTFEGLAVKFIDHFLAIANAINRVGHAGMWDEEDGFYYDVLRQPDGTATRLKVRSIVGLLPLCATTIVSPLARARAPRLEARFLELAERTPELLKGIHPAGEGHRGYGDRGILAVVSPERLRRLLARMLDEREFLSPYGIRALSRVHADHPYVFRFGADEFRVEYLPAESNSGMFGGNSNWRGPIWMPVNALVIRALMQFYAFYGDEFRVECPAGSGHMMTLFEVATDLARRLARIFERDDRGRRPVFGGVELFQTDPHWRDHILFYEYFHGDNGAGLGASHQTGWTGLVATLLQIFGSVTAADILAGRGRAAVAGAQP